MAALNVVAPGGRGFCSSMQLPVSRHPSYTVLCCSESPARSLRTKLSPASRATRRRYSDDQLVSAATPSPPKSSNHPRLQPKDGIVDTVLLRYDKPSKQAGLRTSKQDENTKADDEVATRRQKAKKQESPDDVVRDVLSVCSCGVCVTSCVCLRCFWCTHTMLLFSSCYNVLPPAASDSAPRCDECNLLRRLC